jgi:hypothetical protein
VDVRIGVVGRAFFSTAVHRIVAAER